MQAYNNNSIKALTDREHVRLRPSMYIGNSNIQGLNQLIYEICDNSIDEYLEGFGNVINVHIYNDCSVRVQDFGRGVPVGMTKDANGHDINSLTLAFSKLMAGGKYNQKNYSVSSGTFGIGSSVVNFCSSFFYVTVKRDGKVFQQKFERGIPVTDVEIIGQATYEDGKEVTGTEIYYKPDSEIFQQTLQPGNEVRTRLIELAALNSGLTINYINDLTKSNETFYYENGIINYINEIIKGKKLLFDKPIYIKDIENINGKNIQCELTFILDDELESSSSIRSFVNNINTYMGGTHLNGLKNAIKNVCNDFGIKKKLIKEQIEQKYYLDGFYAVISLKMQNPSFEGQTKIKLNNPEVETAIENIIKRYFDNHPQKDIQDILSTIVTHAVNIKAAELAAKRARAEKRSTNKIARQNLPIQLADCVNAGTAKYSELIMCEGQSASGCVSKNTLIHLADNRDVTIQDLVKEFNEGKKNYVFCRDDNLNIHIRPIVNAFQTQFEKQLYRITLDNNMILEATANHLIMRRDGMYVPMKDLKINDSLMPLRINYKYRERAWFGDYYVPQIHIDRRYVNIATLVANDYLDKVTNNQKYDLHHIDYEPCNNNPENLIYLTPQEHSQLHADQQKYWSDLNIKQLISKKSKENWQNPEYQEKMKFIYDSDTNPLVKAHRERMKNDSQYREQVIARFQKYRDENPGQKQHLSQYWQEIYNSEQGQELRKRANEKSKEQWNNEELKKWRAEETRKRLQKQKEDDAFKLIHDKAVQTRIQMVKMRVVDIFKRLIDKTISINRSNYTQERIQYMQEMNTNERYIPTWNKARSIVGFNARKDNVEQVVRDFINNFNHRIVNIEIVDYNDYVYDLEIEEYHNFAISSGIFIHNSIKSARDAKVMAVLPLRGKVLNVEKASFEQFIKSPAIQRIIASLGTSFGKSFNLENLRYDKIIMACFKGDTKVKMLDGTIKTFEELVKLERQNPNQDYWVYSCKSDGTIVPGKMRHPRITQYVQDTIKVTLDDGGVLETTLDHRFMLRDGFYCEAQHLKVGDSLMPLYTKINTDKTYNFMRELVFDNNTNKWRFTHHMVVEHRDGVFLQTGKHIHHKDYNFLNNTPDNLEWMDGIEHHKTHSKEHITEYNQSQEHRDRVKQLHQDGVYEHTYWGNNGYNGSEAQKQMLKALNQREDMKQMHSKTFKIYNSSEQNRETTRQLNQREDVKLLQKQGKIVHNVACLIRKKISFNEQSFQDKKQIVLLKQYLVSVPTLEKINEIFNSFDDMLQQAIKYEQDQLTDDMFKSLTDVKTVSKNRIQANLNTKRNSMAKIGKQVLDQNLELNETNYTTVKLANKSKAPRWENWNQYFKTIDELIELSKNYNHKVIKLERIHYDEPIPMYDFTVENYHNFAAVTSIQDGSVSGCIVHQCDADVDGLHIRSLLITFLYNYMKPLIENGYLYAAVPPLYKIIYKNKSFYLKDDKELEQWRSQHKSDTYDVQRFKGLGEMSPEELWQTILDPEHRTLKQITIDDVKDAEDALAVCMGADAEPRRQFIEENAYKIEQLNL